MSYLPVFRIDQPCMILLVVVSWVRVFRLATVDQIIPCLSVSGTLMTYWVRSTLCSTASSLSCTSSGSLIFWVFSFLGLLFRALLAHFKHENFVLTVVAEIFVTNAPLQLKAASWRLLLLIAAARALVSMSKSDAGLFANDVAFHVRVHIELSVGKSQTVRLLLWVAIFALYVMA